VREEELLEQELLLKLSNRYLGPLFVKSGLVVFI
jgi:hypothetical protein